MSQVIMTPKSPDSAQQMANAANEIIRSLIVCGINEQVSNLHGYCLPKCWDLKNNPKLKGRIKKCCDNGHCDECARICKEYKIQVLIDEYTIKAEDFFDMKVTAVTE